MSIDKIIEKYSKPITESFNLAHEFEQLAKHIQKETDTISHNFVSGYKKLLNAIDSTNDNKKKIELRKKFVDDVMSSIKYLSVATSSGLDKITAHIP